MSEEIIVIAPADLSLDELGLAANLPGPRQFRLETAYGKRSNGGFLYVYEDVLVANELENKEWDIIRDSGIDSPKFFVMSYRCAQSVLLTALTRLLETLGGRILVDNNRDLVLRGDLLLKRFRTEGTDFFFQWSE